MSEDSIAQLDLVTTIKEAKHLVKLCIQNKEPIMLWGGPGIGKSQMVQQIGEELNRPVIDIRLALMGSEDIKGYPYRDENTNKMKFSIANDFPTDPDSNAIIFFDEINAALPSTQLAMYQLILDRKIGDYVLPKGVAMVAAGNRESDRGGIFSLPKPLENRFAHIEVQCNTDQWVEWAIANSVDPSIIGFISQFKEKLYSFDSKTKTRAFATPRSWSKTSKLLSNSSDKSDKMVRAIVSSCVGTPMAGEFLSYRKLLVNLPNPTDVLEGKVGKMKETVQMSLHYALVTNLLYALKESVQTVKEQGEDGMDTWFRHADNFFKFLLDNKDQIGEEFLVMAISTGANVYKLPFQMKKIPHMKKVNEIISSLVASA